MNVAGFLKMAGEIFPVFVDWMKWLISLSDEEFEKISKTWPAPTKTKMAWLRAEAKAHAEFFGEDGG